MASTQKYLGAATPFGKVVYIEDRVYNPAVTVEERSGATATYPLPFLIAHGLILEENELSTSRSCLQNEPDKPRTLCADKP